MDMEQEVWNLKKELLDLQEKILTQTKLIACLSANLESEVKRIHFTVNEIIDSMLV